MRITLNDRLMVESLGEEVLVFDSKSAQVARFSGEQADLIRTLSVGQSVDIAPSHTLQQLLDTGVVVQAGLFSRRKALTLGAGAVGLGAVSLLMPTAAMAQSSEPSPAFGFTISDGEGSNTGLDFDVKLAGTENQSITAFELSTLGATSGFNVSTNNFDTGNDPLVTFDGLNLTEGDSFWIRWTDGAVFSEAEEASVLVTPE